MQQTVFGLFLFVCDIFVATNLFLPPLLSLACLGRKVSHLPYSITANSTHLIFTFFNISSLFRLLVSALRQNLCIFRTAHILTLALARSFMVTNGDENISGWCSLKLKSLSYHSFNLQWMFSTSLTLYAVSVTCRLSIVNTNLPKSGFNTFFL